MKQNDIARAVAFVSGPATLSCIASDGEVIFQQALSGGRHALRQWLTFMPEDADLEVDGEATVVVPSGIRARPIRFGEGSHDTGANPDFQVTAATRNAREMNLLLQRIEQSNRTLDRKLTAIQSATARTNAGPKTPADEAVIEAAKLTEKPADVAADGVQDNAQDPEKGQED